MDPLASQRSIADEVRFTGIGLHSGETIRLALLPAAPDTGIVFVRRSGDRSVEIPARSDFVTATRNATTLARDGLQISTVEHLLAALRGLGVDNLRVEVDGPELPVMDGSAAPFAAMIRTAGLAEQPVSRRVLEVRRVVSCCDGERSIRIEPGPRGLELHYAVDFAHPAIGRQEFALAELTPAAFETELAPARTFGFLSDVDALRAAGLARGASLDNTIVLDDRGVMNPGGLRFADEFVRHKLLDLVGDLALLGAPLQARVRVERGGHGLHRAAVDALLADADAWRLVPVSPGGRARGPGAPSSTDR